MAIADINSILSRSFRNDRISKISWEKGNYLNVTMCVTEECNLECTYCYMVGKNNFKKMTFETAKKIVDFIVNDPYCNNLSDNLLIDFIGGEPLLEMELIDKISDYICLLLYSKRHKWFNNLQFSFSTNGTLLQLFCNHVLSLIKNWRFLYKYALTCYYLSDYLKGVNKYAARYS